MKLFIALICSYLLLAADDQNISKTKIVATVNGTSITQHELDRAVNTMLPQTYYHGNLSPEKRKHLETEALDKLIRKVLFVEYAKAQGIEVPKNRIKARENQIINAYGSEERFEKALTLSAMTRQEFLEEIIAEQMLQLLYEKEIKVTLSDDDLETYYQKNRHKFKIPEQRKISMIYVKNDPTIKDGYELAKKRMEIVVEKLDAGEEFGVVAEKYSHDMSRINGGEIGFVHKGQLPEEVESVAYELPIGERSGIIESDVGFYLVRVEGKRPSTQLPFEKVKQSLKADLTRTRQEKNNDELLAKLKSQAKIKIVE